MFFSPTLLHIFHASAVLSYTCASHRLTSTKPKLVSALTNHSHLITVIAAWLFALCAPLHCFVIEHLQHFGGSCSAAAALFLEKYFF